MTTPFIRCAEAFDAHPGDHELARLIDAIGERRAPSGVGRSGKSGRLLLASAEQRAIESYRAMRDAILAQEASEAQARCHCGETPLAQPTASGKPAADGITHAPDIPLRRVPRFVAPIEEDGE